MLSLPLIIGLGGGRFSSRPFPNQNSAQAVVIGANEKACPPIWLESRLPGKKGPFRCDCGYKLWAPEKATDWRVPANIVARLGEYGDWLLQSSIKDHQGAYNLMHREPHGLERDFDRYPNNSELNDRPRLLTIWASLDSRCRKLPFNFDRSFANRSSSKLVSVLTSKRIPELWGDRYYAAARSVYKSICRHFYRRIFRKHRRVIYAIASKRHDYARTRPRGLHVHGIIDPVAQAFVLWKCYWEWRHPDELFREWRRETTWRWQRHEKERYAEDVHVDSPEGLPAWKERFVRDEILVRSVATRCFGTFDEILARIDAVQKTRSVDFIPVNMIDGRHTATMTTEVFSDASIRFTWFWTVPSWLQSKKFARWLEDVPTDSQVNEYLRKFPGKGMRAWTGVLREFAWPPATSASDQFVHGPSRFEEDPDY